MQKKYHKRLLALALALTMIVMPCLSSGAFAASEDLESRGQKLSERKDDLEKKSGELDEKLRDVRSKQEEKETYKQTLEEKISVVQEQISVAEQRIEQLDEEINGKTAAISDKQTEIEGSYDLLKKRLCSIYMAGDTSTLDIILGAKSMKDLLDKADMLKAVTQHDKELIDNLDVQVQDIQQQRDEIAQKREEVASEKTQLDAKRAELADLKLENDRILLDLKQDEEKTKEEKQSVQDEMDRYMEEFMEWQKQYEASLKPPEPDPETPSSKPDDGNSGSSAPSGGGETSGNGSSSGSSKPDDPSSDPAPDPDPDPEPSGGLYAWPVPGFYHISSYYGNRPEYGYHRGLDIASAGIFRAAIVAAEDGVVTKVNRTDFWGSGWGYHVIIRHPDGNSTLYAHCDQIVNGLAVGQTVKRGQQIAYVGESGQAYGVHLHFEVWKDSQYSQRVDPLPYLPH